MTMKLIWTRHARYGRGGAGVVMGYIREARKWKPLSRRLAAAPMMVPSNGQGYGVHDRAGAEQDEDHSGFAVAFAQPAPQADQDGHGAEDADDPAGVDGGDDRGQVLEDVVHGALPSRGWGRARLRLAWIVCGQPRAGVVARPAGACREVAKDWLERLWSGRSGPGGWWRS